MEGHLLCNGVFKCSLYLFHGLMQAHKHPQELQRGKPGHNMKGHPPPMLQRRQSDWWDGEKWESVKTTIWGHRRRSKRGEKRGVREIEIERHRQGQTGSGSHIWQVKLAVINPAEWPYLCSVVCLPVVSVLLWGWGEAGLYSYRADRAGPELCLRPSRYLNSM